MNNEFGNCLRFAISGLYRNCGCLQATRVMDEEERHDTEMRDRFKAKWTPKPSAELTVQLRQEADKYRSIMENAVRADAVVKEKYNKHRRNMDLLSKGEVRIINRARNTLEFASNKVFIGVFRETSRFLTGAYSIPREIDFWILM